MRVEIYSDVACPWCYIGDARFDRALEQFAGAEDVEVLYRPYQLDPDAPSEAVPMWSYLERRFGPNARQLVTRVIDQARAEDLPMDYDRGLTVNTLNAHRLMWIVNRDRGPEEQTRAAEALFRAHFAEGRDVSDYDELVSIAKSLGMDAVRVRTALEAGEGLAEVQDAIAAARQLGVTAVPTFVFDGKYAVEGAQPTTVFQQVLDEVARLGATTPADGGETCADGSCEV